VRPGGDAGGPNALAEEAALRSSRPARAEAKNHRRCDAWINKALSGSPL